MVNLKFLERLKLAHVLAVVMLVVASGCTVQYSFTGVNISQDVKTYSVAYFQNRARLINPTLSQTITEDLKDKLQKQTSLDEIRENGDIMFEGQITGYDTKPVSVEADDETAQNRLTITIQVKYTDNKDSENSFEKSFSAYEDFDSSNSLSDVEDSLVPDIIEQLLEDIFNATIANW